MPNTLHHLVVDNHEYLSAVRVGIGLVDDAIQVLEHLPDAHLDALAAVEVGANLLVERHGLLRMLLAVKYRDSLWHKTNTNLQKLSPFKVQVYREAI